jgi:hypothetical protein
LSSIKEEAKEEDEAAKKAAEELVSDLINPALEIERMQAQAREEQEMRAMEESFSREERREERMARRAALFEETMSGSNSGSGSSGDNEAAEGVSKQFDEKLAKELFLAGDFKALTELDGVPDKVLALAKTESDKETGQQSSVDMTAGASAAPSIQENAKSTDTPPPAPEAAPPAAPVMAQEPDVAPDVLRRQAVDKAIQQVKDSGRIGWGNMTADDEKTIAKFVDDKLGPDAKPQDIKDFTKSLGGADRTLANELTQKVSDRHDEIEKSNTKAAAPAASNDSHPFAKLLEGVSLIKDRLPTDPSVNTPTGQLVLAMLEPGGVVPASTIAGGGQGASAGMGSAA